MDDAYRYMFHPGGRGPFELTDKEWENVEWAYNQTLDLASGDKIVSAKDDLKLTIPFFDRPGEVDAEIPNQLCSTDVKSGQIYEYRRQQASYSLGEMDKWWSDKWTVFMLYMDLRRLVTYHFTREIATEIVKESREKYDNPSEPKINVSCSWCRNFLRCPAQLLLAEKCMGHLTPTFNFEDIASDPIRLGEFLTSAYSIAGNSGFYPRARDAAKEFIVKRVEVPGWTLTSNMHLKKQSQ
jgi:hypothetical protein